MIDVGKEYNLRQQSAADILAADPLQLSGGTIGFNIGEATARFPNTVAMLAEAGFNNTEILESTYPYCAIQECSIKTAGGWAGDGWAGRDLVHVPSGVWQTNRELRWGQQPLRGDGPGFNFGTGGTIIKRIDTDWKSIHGSQNDNVRILVHPHTYCGENATTIGSSFHLGVGAGQEWCHHFHVHDIALEGQGGPAVFADPADYVEVGIMYYGPGETSHINNVTINHFKGFAILIDGKVAPCTIGGDVSMFNNSIASIGLCTGSLSELNFHGLSSDNTPYMLFMFRRGSNALGDGTPFMPGALPFTPGGMITFDKSKIEAFACRSAYGGLDACTPGTYVGRGGRWARLTGRFQFDMRGCTLNVHGPSGSKLFTAIELVDDWHMSTVDPSGGWGSIPLDNSKVKIDGVLTKSVKYWMHDWKRQRAWRLNELAPDDHRTEFQFQDSFDSGNAFYKTATGNSLHLFDGATYRGRQPFASNLQTHNGNAAPVINYDEILGNNYP